MRLLQAVDALQLLHLKATREEEGQGQGRPEGRKHPQESRTSEEEGGTILNLWFQQLRAGVGGRWFLVVPVEVVYSPSGNSRAGRGPVKEVSSASGCRWTL